MRDLKWRGVHTPTGDPIVATWLIAIGFFCLGVVGLDNLAMPIFDELHYIPAANRLLIGDVVTNREHPLLAKELIALAIWLFGESPFGWRIAPLVAGTLALVSWSRAVWWYSRSQVVSLLFAVLLASNFLLFSLSRLAMLDVFMFAFTGGALVSFLLGLERPRWLIACGISLGLALASKWSAAPVALALALCGLWKARDRPLHSILCLIILPAVVYSATFAPLLTVQRAPLEVADMPSLQLAMLQRLSLFVRDNPFSSQWWEWVINTRPMVLARETDGIVQIALIGGNPFTMLAIPPAAGLALLSGRHFELARPLAIMYLVTLSFWAMADKPVQYEFHYLLPSTFGLAALSVIMSRYRRWAVAFGAIALLFFAWFLPVMSAAPLTSRNELGRYDWLPGWGIHRPVRTTSTPDQRDALQAAEDCLDTPRSCF